MSKKTFQSNVSSSSEAATRGKKSLKELGKETGSKPDAWDYKNIAMLIETYEHAYPGRLKKMAEDVRIEAALSGRTKKFGVISKDSDMRVAFWLPEDLQQVIERGYPSFWTNKKHAEWFIKKFPIFMRAERF